MSKAELRATIKKQYPTVSFETRDALGTRMNPAFLHAVIPLNVDIKAFEAFVASLGHKATWPCCSQVYAKYRSIR